jgi:hypothetical protein
VHACSVWPGGKRRPTCLFSGIHALHQWHQPFPLVFMSACCRGAAGTPDEPLLLVSIVLRAAATKGIGATGGMGAVTASGGSGVSIGPLLVLDRYGGMVFANAAMSTLLGYAHKSFLLLRLEVGACTYARQLLPLACSTLIVRMHRAQAPRRCRPNPPCRPSFQSTTRPCTRAVFRS